MASIDLLSTTNRVEAPIVIATIANYSFGAYNKTNRSTSDSNGVYIANSSVINYPNFIQSLRVKKINGTVNTYTLVLKYAIRQGDDPNLIEKILSKVSIDRKITFTYGDCSIPSFMYKEEEAIITDVKSSFDAAGSSIQYTITAVSQMIKASAGSFNFPKRVAKPSDVIKELLYNSQYGLLEVFPGMVNKQKVLASGLIASDDKKVELQGQMGVSILSYLKYLVSCMSSLTNDNSIIKNSQYNLIVMDEVSEQWDGAYFKVIKIDGTLKNINSLDTYEIDVGFIGQNIVTNFTIDDDQTYSILYNYSNQISQSEYVYKINDEGNWETIYSPTVTNSRSLLKTTEAEKTWWTNVTQYPLNATLTIKGLLKPAILMTYVKLNVLFYGKKHISSGYYVVTEQTDSVDSNGFRTTLKLLRIKGDED